MHTLANKHHQATVHENIKYEKEVIKVGILYAQLTNSTGYLHTLDFRRLKLTKS